MLLPQSVRYWVEENEGTNLQGINKQRNSVFLILLYSLREGCFASSVNLFRCKNIARFCSGMNMGLHGLFAEARKILLFRKHCNIHATVLIHSTFSLFFRLHSLSFLFKTAFQYVLFPENHEDIISWWRLVSLSRSCVVKDDNHG